MDLNLGTILTSLLPQLGFGVIFLYLFQQEKGDNKANVSSRDTRIKELTEQLVDLSKKNIEVMTIVNNTMQNNTLAMQNNTQSIKELGEKLQSSSRSLA